MTKEDYLRKKGRLPKEPLGTIYTFTSDRKGVKEIVEHLIWEKRISSYRIDGENRIPIIEYKVKESPYLCEIIEGGIVGSNEGHGSGFGDLWSWTQFCSLDRNSLEIERGKEAIRIQKKYNTI